MLLPRTVLAVVYGSLLVSALPDPGDVLVAERVEPDLDRRPCRSPLPSNEHIAPEDGIQWNRAAEHPQLVMDTAYSTHYTEDTQEPNPFGPVPPPEVPEPWPPRPQHPSGPPHDPHGPFPKPGPHPPPGAPNKTIYQWLEGDPHFSRLFKLVNYTEDITKILNDTSANITLFALPDWGFPKRPPPPPGPPGHDDDDFAVGHDYGTMLATAESLMSSVKPDDEVLKKLFKYIFLYQILPTSVPLSELASNLTHATSLALSDGSLDGEPLRVRVGRAPGIIPLFTVNLFAKIVRPDLPASNGLIHVVSGPVLPPPSIFQASFILPQVFSTLTSALQRVGLTDDVEWRNSEGSVAGSPAVTFFAPTNKAFARLPRKLRLFLFSPFGEKVLKKLLQFHIVPEFVLHSNYLHNASDSDVKFTSLDSKRGQLFGELTYGSGDIADLLRDTISPTGDGAIRKIGHFPCNARIDESWPVMPVHPPFPPVAAACSNPFIPRSPPFAPHHCGGPLPPPPPFPPRDDGLPHPFPGPPEPHHPHSPPGDEPRHPPDHPPRPPHKPPFPHHPPPVAFSQNVTAPTLLANHSLHVHVVQVEHKFPLPIPPRKGPKHHNAHYETIIFAHGVKVELPDIPMRNGVIHVVEKLLNPMRKPGGPHHRHESEEPDASFWDQEEDEWAGWEEWLPRWADEE